MIDVDLGNDDTFDLYRLLDESWVKEPEVLQEERCLDEYDLPDISCSGIYIGDF